MRALFASLAFGAFLVFLAAPVTADQQAPAAPPAPPPPATTPVCSTPVGVTSVFDQTAAAAGNPGQRWAAPGDTVQVVGQGFLQANCAVTVTVGDVAIPVAQTAISTAGDSLTFAAPAYSSTNAKGVNGPVIVQLTDPGGAVATSNSNYHFLEQPAATVQEAQPAEATVDPVAGFGFNSGGDSLSVTGAFDGCPGQTAQVMNAEVVSDTQLNLPVPATYCNGPVTIAVTDPHYNSDPGAPDDSMITVAVAAGTVDIAAVVAGVSPTTVGPGDFITVSGSGFGPRGAASIGGLGVPVAWSDERLVITAPQGATTGLLQLHRTVGDHATFPAGTITVVKPPVGTGSGGTGSGTGGLGSTPTYPVSVNGSAATSPGRIGGSSGGPTIFNIPYSATPASGSRAPQGLVGAAQSTQDQLTIAPIARQDAVNSDVGVVVTLIVQGNTVAGAPISVSLVSAPGADAAVKPPTGVTDGKGQFHTRLHLSRLAGDHLLLARSGSYSDEVHVLGQTASTGSSIRLPFGNINVNGNPLIVWLSVACFVLIALGVIVNINVMRRFIWSVTGGRIVALLRKQRARIHVA